LVFIATLTPTADTEDATNVVTVGTGWTDPAGNAPAGTTNSANYTIDNILPTLSAVHIVSNNSDTAKAKNGDKITLTFTASESLTATPVVTILGHAVTVTNPSGLNYSAEYTVVGTDTNGVAPFTINFTDVAGNAGTQVTVTSDASSVTVDRTAPSGYTVTIDQAQITTANQSAISFTFAGAETDTTYHYSIDDTNGATAAITGTGTVSSPTMQVTPINVSSLSDGTLTLTVYLVDATGNQGANATHTRTKDTTAPTFTINSGTDTPGPVKNDVINVTVADANTVDVRQYGYSADATCNGSDTWGTPFTSGVDFTVTGDHTNYLCVKATDNFNNTAYQTVGQLNTDNTIPALVLGSLFTNQTLTGGLVYSINWTASDLNFSTTPMMLEYSIDGGGTWNTIVASTEDDGVYAWSVPTSINSSSAKIKITATDTATNSSSVESSTFTIAYSSTADITPPVITLNSPNGAESWAGGSSHVITWTATDNVTPAGSIGIKLEYSTNGSGSWTTIISSTDNDGAYLWTVPNSASTNVLVKVTATDATTNAGSDLSNAVFTITAQPSASICDDVGDGNWTCDITLSTGWNLISLPVIVSNTAIANVLSDVSNINNVNTVQYWDTVSNGWKYYIPGAGGNTLDTIRDGNGYWIFMNSSDSLAVTGTKTPAAPDHAPTYSVASGWNLVGFKSTISQITSTYLSNLSTLSYTLLNASNENKNSGNMDSGKGYWLWASGVGSIITSSETE
ncbi:MAG: Ig-like domain-containing protein, partial [Bacteroidota bacterium]